MVDVMGYGMSERLNPKPVVRVLIALLLAVVAAGAARAADTTSDPTPDTASDVSFRNDVMAVLSKAGCNAGACHGNKSGKGGFKLSLRGQDPDGDYNVL